MKDEKIHDAFMRKAIDLSIENINNGGGPFGAVIVKDNQIVSTGVNQVTCHNDPTAHAEVNAIRNACQKLNTFDLSGCTIYSSCEPCPMCLSAIYWAHIDRLFYANTKKDADEIGFSDAFIYKELALDPKERELASENLLHQEALEAFKIWTNKEDKIKY